MLRTLLIDDEKPCLNRLKILLAHYCSTTVDVVGECQTVDAALDAIDALKPDLIFLDVHLADKTGFDLLGGVALINFDVVFSTAHDEYALRAFQADAVDYLLKPIDSEKLIKAVGKVLARSPKDRTEHHNQLSQAVDRQDRKITRIGIPTEKGRTYIDVASIVYCKSDGGYTKFFGAREKGRENLMGMASDSLKEFEIALNGSNFCRIHNSHLINLAYLKSYINGRGGQVEMTDGTVLDVSDQRKEEFKRRTQDGLF
jgi:two-component system LytT family response regulator